VRVGHQCPRSQPVVVRRGGVLGVRQARQISQHGQARSATQRLVPGVHSSGLGESKSNTDIRGYA
jgi:hypothetical protein